MEGSAAKSDRGMQFEVHVILLSWEKIKSRNKRSECDCCSKINFIDKMGHYLMNLYRLVNKSKIYIFL